MHTIVMFSQDYHQEYKFQRLHVDNGLAHNYTLAIGQDSMGFIWIGTQHGLQRYDGQKLTTYLHDSADSTSIAGNFISFIEINGDNQLLIGFEDSKSLDRYDPITESFIHEKTNISATTFTILKDGDIWLGSGKELRQESRGNSSSTNHQFAPHPKHNLSFGLWVYDIFESKDNSVWAGTERGLYQVKQDDSSGTWWLPCDDSYMSTDTTFFIYETIEDESGSLWFATEQGLFVQSKSSDCLVPFRSPDKLPFPFEGQSITSIIFDSEGQLWISTFADGVYIMNLTMLHIEYIPAQNSNGKGGELTSIDKIFIDHAGNVWFLSSSNGVHIYHPESQIFKWFIDSEISNSSNLSSPLLMVYEDSQEKLWLLGDQVKTDGYPALDNKILESLGHCYAMSEDSDGDFWFSTSAGGVKKLDVSQQTVQHFFEDPKILGIQNYSNTVTAELVDSKGNFWAGFWGGAAAFIDVANIGSPTLFPCPIKETDAKIGCYIQVIYESRDGHIWFGSANTGFSVFDPKEASWKNFQKADDQPNGLQHNYVRTIIEDKTGMIWVGTYGGGLYRFDRETEEFRHYSQKNGIPDDLIEELIEDQQGYIWIVTTNRLTRFDPIQGTFQIFDDEDGLPNSRFNRLTYSKSSSQLMHLSTNQGYVTFDPKNIQIDAKAPNTAIVKMTCYQSDSNGAKPIEIKGISEKDFVELSYRDYILNFEFAAITFHKASKTIIEYKLDGFQNDWIRLDKNRQVSFTSLPAGHYTLLVRSANADGVWDMTPAALDIYVSPPWWKAWWAYIIYFILTMSGILYFWKKETGRIKLKNQLEKEQLEFAQLKELDEAKTRFFSNISHEFRTPLTVILGMSEEIEHPEIAKTLIQQSGQNLLRLINQMLDINKMDAGKLTLQASNNDISQYLRYLLDSFQSLAAHKDIDLLYRSKISSCYMYYDSEKIQHIVSNLLSNAIKFTPRGGKVILEFSQENINEVPTSDMIRPIKMKISDNGLGMTTEDQARIFDRFYQVNNPLLENEQGTGIGLAFTKELVQLMNGSIEVKSIENVGSEFTVSLPYTPEAIQTVHQAVNQAEVKKIEIPTGTDTATPEERSVPILSSQSGLSENSTINSQEIESSATSILIIEDNPEVVKYLITILEKDYDISVAENGQIGIEKAVELIPDIVISDVMMPEKDGIAVTEFLKNDERTSHIPIILLTAKADIESRLIGLERGADAYFAKPFNKKELLIRLSKLIELRKNLQNRYATVIATDLPAKEEQIEDLFLRKVNKIIDTNLSDADFGVSEISKEIGLSQSQLFRKLKALTGKSTVAYLRNFRLYKAKELLEHGQKNVSEVAYAVGYNDPLYFSRLFSKEFGIPPKQVL